MLASFRNMFKKDFLPNPFVTSALSIDGTSHRHAKPLQFAAFCVAVRSKSEARYLESHLIRVFKHKGFDIRKDSDGQHRRFGASSSHSS